MKIVNAKGIVRYAMSGGPPEKEGFLLKRGDLNRGFQRRWFVLKGNLLFYYEKRTDKEPVGMIILEGCTIELAECEDVDNYAFQISFSGSGTRTYVLCADSQDAMEAWMKALSCAPYEYIKLVVAELENQLEELSSTENARIVQAAERDSRILSQMYAEDSASGKKHPRSAQSYQGDRVNPFNDLAESMGNLGAFKGRPSSSSQWFGVATWQGLGVSNFHGMHEQMRQQIKELGLKTKHTSN